MGEVAPCDDTAAAVTRCAFDARPVWAPKQRFAVVSGTMTSARVRRSRTTVDFNRPLLDPSPYRRGLFSYLLEPQLDRPERAEVGREGLAGQDLEQAGAGAGRDQVAGVQPAAASRQRPREPGHRLERVPEDVAAPARGHRAAVDPGRDGAGGEVGRLPA